MDIKDFYINHRMDREDYIMTQTSIIPEEFMIYYKFKDKIQNGYIFVGVTKGMYVLPKEVSIAHDALVQHMEPYAYHPRYMDT